MLEGAIGTVIGAVITLIGTALWSEIQNKRRKGKLRLTIEYHFGHEWKERRDGQYYFGGEKGAYIEAIIVNVGDEPIIVNWVVVRDKFGNEHKHRPALHIESSFAMPTSRTLTPLDRLEITYALVNLQKHNLQIKNLTTFEAVDTLDKVHRCKIPKQVQKQIAAWVARYGTQDDA